MSAMITKETIDWIKMFPATKVVHLECGSSDHKPLVILPKGVQIKHKKPWRFEQMWLEDEGCGKVVDLAWRRICLGNSMAQVEGKIKVCQAKLKQWSRTSFRNITHTLQEKKAVAPAGRIESN